MSEIRSERVREIERYGESDREGQGEATRERVDGELERA